MLTKISKHFFSSGHLAFDEKELQTNLEALNAVLKGKQTEQEINRYNLSNKDRQHSYN